MASSAGNTARPAFAYRLMAHPAGCPPTFANPDGTHRGGWKSGDKQAPRDSEKSPQSGRERLRRVPMGLGPTQAELQSGSMDESGHLLVELFRDAARGEFPPADGSIWVVDSPPGRVDAVVAFTAHHVIAAPVPEEEIRARLEPEDLGSPMKATFLAWLEEHLGSPAGMLDPVLVAPSAADSDDVVLDEVTVAPDHPRVRLASLYRDDVRVFADADERGVVTLGRGLAGRWELSIEIEPAHRGRGLGRRMAAAATRLVPAGDPLFAQVSPGNASSLRAFLAAGYRPIGAEVLFIRADQ
jgi:GNAT superfamily N-acetyltransferase